MKSVKEFPQVPEELMEPVSNLTTQDVNDQTLSGTVTTVTINYGMYHELKVKYEGWQKWYNTQKKINDDLNASFGQ